MNLICPNCGAKFIFPEGTDWHNGDGTPHGCGDCAQAGVRPRSLYGLVPDEGND